MKYFVMGALVVTFLLGGCRAADYLGNTRASYSAANGFYYKSNKNQEGLEASGEVNKDGTAKFEIKTNATTPEAAIKAALESNAALTQMLSKLLDAAMAAGQQALTKGAPVSKSVSATPIVP